MDQVECFRRGIDAPSSTVKLDVNPSKLSKVEREFLASIITDGFKVGANDERYRICPPTLAGLREMIRKL